MRTFILPGVVLALGAFLLPSAASAQSWGDVPSWERPAQPQAIPPRPYYQRPVQPYYPPPAYRYPSYTYRPRPSGSRYSSMCVTSRGECSTGRPVPVGSPCRCFIPGFGQKRGAVEAAY